ncbi:hypothetical protein, partial [Siminovitchia terrae]|uniref:hypothetical protein n=1 Tax=Siminovitchia terrae TaxID=1914933 RepID=UPI0028AAF732
GFEPPLNGIPIGIHLTTYRSGRFLLNEVKLIVYFSPIHKLTNLIILPIYQIHSLLLTFNTQNIDFLSLAFVLPIM